ncbi:MAG: hypothetical protein CVU42_13665 [Chloroflexi bacterium HGW-Chloroflexi-4]|jgi:DNA invertase Pin-like site-specific DNA recombinase|nr:MAG: hypothetical protein CVU42_13665 [Chloroflexi bacterium HGW-Chloroflexi-4]
MNTAIPFQAGARVVAYLRDSGGDDQELSVAQQRAFVTQWCLENNLILSAVFADLARPGSSTIGRSKFLEMIRHFEDPACLDAGVLIWKYSRFSRDVDDSQYYRSLLRMKGFIVHSLKDDVPNDDFGRLYESVIDFTNARFLKDMREDVKRGLRHLVTTYGALPGTPPRGFMRQPVEISQRRDGSAHIGSRWVPDPAMWENCRRAWQMRAAGIPIRDIHKELHLFNNRTSYTAFFTNRLYLGELRYSDLIIPNYTEPLIDQSTWDAVQAINETNWLENDPHRRSEKSHPRRISSDFMLSGLLHCPRCSSVMNGKSVTFNGQTKRNYYICANAQRKMECDAKSIPQDDIEGLVILGLKEAILRPSSIQIRAKKLKQQAESEINGINADHRELLINIHTNKLRINNLVDRIANDTSAPQSIIDKIKELELDQKKYQASLDNLNEQKKSLTAGTITRERAKELSEYIMDLFDTGDLDTKRTILKSLIKSVSAERIDKKVRANIIYCNPVDS